MATVANILTAKGHVIYRVGPQETVLEAVQRMAEHNIGSLLVVASNGGFLGIVTERDCLHRVVLEDRKSRDTPVEAIMTLDVYAVTPDMSVDQCMRIMTDRRVRHLPVMEGTRLVGIVSIGDAVKMQTSEHRSDIEQLKQYIHGRA